MGFEGFFFKVGSESEVLICIGREFQKVGAAVEEGLSLQVVKHCTSG